MEVKQKFIYFMYYALFLLAFAFGKYAHSQDYNPSIMPESFPQEETVKEETVKEETVKEETDTVKEDVEHENIDEQ